VHLASLMDASWGVGLGCRVTGIPTATCRITDLPGGQSYGTHT
jgi:hypothetical protein